MRQHQIWYTVECVRSCGYCRRPITCILHLPLCILFSTSAFYWYPFYAGTADAGAADAEILMPVAAWRPPTWLAKFCIFILLFFWNYLGINLIMLVVQSVWRMRCTAVLASITGASITVSRHLLSRRVLARPVLIFFPWLMDTSDPWKFGPETVLGHFGPETLQS